MNSVESSELGKPTGIRFSADEKSRLQLEAKVAGLTFGEYVRRCCNKKSTTSRVELAAIRELCRLGGLLKELNGQSSGVYRDDIALTIATIRRQIAHLASGTEQGRELPAQSGAEILEVGGENSEITAFSRNSLKKLSQELAEEVVNDSKKICQ